MQILRIDPALLLVKTNEAKEAMDKIDREGVFQISEIPDDNPFISGASAIRILYVTIDYFREMSRPSLSKPLGLVAEEGVLRAMGSSSRDGVTDAESFLADIMMGRDPLKPKVDEKQIFWKSMQSCITLSSKFSREEIDILFAQTCGILSTDDTNREILKTLRTRFIEQVKSAPSLDSIMRSLTK